MKTPEQWLDLFWAERCTTARNHVVMLVDTSEIARIQEDALANTRPTSLEKRIKLCQTRPDPATPEGKAWEEGARWALAQGSYEGAKGKRRRGP